jgi:hypothetical protein
MVNRRHPIAAEYVARWVAMLPNVSANPDFVSFKRGFSPPIWSRRGRHVPQGCIASLTRTLQWEKPATAVAQNEIAQ